MHTCASMMIGPNFGQMWNAFNVNERERKFGTGVDPFKNGGDLLEMFSKI